MAKQDKTARQSTSGTVECPRCGYDLRGEVSRWTDRCPLWGRCNECGLELSWQRVFALAFHPWLFEYHWRDRPLRRMLMMLSRTTMPRRFWTDVRLDDPVHLRPVGTIIAMLVALFLIGYTLMAGAVMHSQLRGFVSAYDLAYFGMIARDVRDYWWSELIDALAMPLVVLLLMPATFCLIPVTLRQARVRMRHVMRIWLYGWGLPCIVAFTWVMIQMLLHLTQLEEYGDWINPWLWPIYRWDIGLYLGHYLIVGMGLGVIAAAWMTLWWSIACRRYLKLPRAPLIAILMAAITVLIGAYVHLHLTT